MKALRNLSSLGCHVRLSAVPNSSHFQKKKVSNFKSKLFYGHLLTFSVKLMFLQGIGAFYLYACVGKETILPQVRMTKYF